MANYDSNYAIAQEISARIGVSPIPFDSVYSIALEIYNELGGEPAEFDSVYSILLGILPLVEGGGSNVIDDNIISSAKTWSSEKISSELDALAGTANSEIEGKETEDFRFVSVLPESGSADEQVVIRGENTDTLYKYVEGSGWTIETPDATKLYFDLDNEALYSYVTLDHQFARISMVNTIVVGSNLNTNADLKALKTPGVYSVVQRLTNATKGDYVKNWTLYVESVDYDEYDKSDSVYQRLVSNYTIQKRTWSATRTTNDGWSSFSTYYAGEIKDSTTSKYYTWSSSKINSGLTELDEKISNVKPIEEVSELPEASENKEKFYRLSSDDNVYVSELKSRTSTTTNRLPDAQQIDKAYLDDGGDIMYYKGAYKIIVSDGEVDGFGWYFTDGEYEYTYITLDNVVNLSDETVIYGSLMNEEGWITDLTEKTITNLDFSLSDLDNYHRTTIGDIDGVYYIPAIYNAPESTQIGNAYLNDSDNYYYTGREITLVVSDGEFKGYGWEYEGDGYCTYLTDKLASNIYYTDSGHTSDVGVLNIFTIDDFENWTISGDTYTNLSMSLDDCGYGSISDIGQIYIPQLNAPDSEQVGNAYIEINDTPYTYIGERVVTDSNNISKDLHGWVSEGNYYFSVAKASDIYFDYGKLLVHNCQEFVVDNGDGTCTLKNPYNPSAAVLWGDYPEFEEDFTVGDLVKYQRTETTEEWGWEKVATEQYVDDAIAEIPQLEAGQNVEIDDNKINAKGYFYNDEVKEELKSIDVILQEAGMPAGQSLGLKISGAAGATTYTYTDNMGGAFAQMVQMSMLPGVGATYQTANGKSGVIAAIDATTITFEKTLDSNNALTNEAVDYVVTITQLFSFTEGMYKYTEGDISAYNFTISGSAGATTYTYTDSTNGLVITMCKAGAILKLQNGKSAKCVSVEKIDSSTGNITFDVTFDEENALNNELVISIYKKNIASGLYSHAEGGGILGGMLLDTTASGYASHAEGAGTTSSGLGSHAEGESSLASGEASHAEGLNATASGGGSHVEGVSTTAQNQGEHAEGNANLSHKVSDTYGNSGNTTHSVGIGYAVNKKNAFEIMQNGDMYVLGVGGYQGTNTKVQDATIKTLQEYIASLEARIAALENPNT